VTGDLAGGLLQTAFFNGVTQRVGLGIEQTPQTTLHIDPANFDVALRIDQMQQPPNNNANYHVLMWDNTTGNVYITNQVYTGNSLAPDDDEEVVSARRRDDAALSITEERDPILYANQSHAQQLLQHNSKSGPQVAARNPRSVSPKTHNGGNTEAPVDYEQMAKTLLSTVNDLHQQAQRSQEAIHALELRLKALEANGKRTTTLPTRQRSSSHANHQH